MGELPTVIRNREHEITSVPEHCDRAARRSDHEPGWSPAKKAYGGDKSTTMRMIAGLDQPTVRSCGAAFRA